MFFIFIFQQFLCRFIVFVLYSQVICTCIRETPFIENPESVHVFANVCSGALEMIKPMDDKEVDVVQFVVFEMIQPYGMCIYWLDVFKFNFFGTSLFKHVCMEGFVAWLMDGTLYRSFI